MDIVIKEINEGLRKLLEDLEGKKNINKKSLADVTEKINDKIDEAKEYRNEVDNAKNKIKILEEEIVSLEEDLNDLNERFGKKDLNAILEAGNKEINSKIMDKQNQITKYRQKIGELTEKARSIKDLLVNLKKDKTIKEERLNIFIKAYEYYSKSLEDIMEFAKNNQNDLTGYNAPLKNETYDYSEVENSSEVFDEIASIDNDENDDEENSDISEINLENIKNEEPEINDEDSLLDKLKQKNFDLEELNRSIDEEYKNIFESVENEPETIKEDNKEEKLKLEETPKENDLFLNKDVEMNNFNITLDELNANNNIGLEPIKVSDPENINIPDFFGNNIISETSLNEPIKETKIDITDFFNKNGLDFNRFNIESQESLRKAFTPEMFKKTIDVLNNNNINLSNIYMAPGIFIESTPIELDKIISKLLTAGQTTNNIELILDTLPKINSVDLNDIINSYGEAVKDVNITDLIIKAKKLGENNGGDL